MQCLRSHRAFSGMALPAGRMVTCSPVAARPSRTSALPVAASARATNQKPQLDSEGSSSSVDLSAFAASAAMYLACAQPALADIGVAASNPFEGAPANSLYVTLALFVMSVPGEGGRPLNRTGLARVCDVC